MPGLGSVLIAGGRALLRPPVRLLRSLLVAARRRRALHRLATELRRQSKGGAIDPALLLAMREAWGNKAFSADPAYLEAIAHRTLVAEGPCLECGSGLTTVVCGIVAESRGITIWSLEQSEEWYERVVADLRLLGVRSVVPWHAPLEEHEGFAWYEMRGRRLPSYFSHVFCDGPAVGPKRWPPAVHARWRAGVVPVLQSEGIRFGEIVLDDADDPRSAELRRLWADRGVTTSVIDTPTGPLIVGRPALAVSGSGEPPPP
ncbi:MAG: hypothetical protein ACRENB_08455 [Gemmatimonadales bacterium]